MQMTEQMNTQGKVAPEKKARENLKDIRHKFMVMSGKGGVGKSTVAVNLAYGLLYQGYTVGLMDADLHGPSVSWMLNLEEKPLRATEDGRIEPVAVTSGLRVVSIGSQLENDRPLVWRGPLKMGIIQQFLGDVNWGTLDYLIIDSPPGTGDEPLSIAQLIPESDGLIIVTTPQDVALMESRKCVNFARELKLPVAGIVENMSGFICPSCGEYTELFKSGGGRRTAEDMGVPFLGGLPLDPELMKSGDEGKPFMQNRKKGETAEKLDEIISNIITFAEDREVK